MPAPNAAKEKMKLRFLYALRVAGARWEQLVKEGVGPRRILSLARGQAYGRSGINNREALSTLWKEDPKFSGEYEAIVAEIRAALKAALPPKERSRRNAAKYRARKRARAQAQPEFCLVLPPRPGVAGLLREAQKCP